MAGREADAVDEKVRGIGAVAGEEANAGGGEFVGEVGRIAAEDIDRPAAPDQSAADGAADEARAADDKCAHQRILAWPAAAERQRLDEDAIEQTVGRGDRVGRAQRRRDTPAVTYLTG